MQKILYNLPMKKKILILILCLFIISGAAFAIRAVTKAEHEAYLKNMGLNETQIQKLEEIDLNYMHARLEIADQSRECRRKNINLSPEACENFHTKMMMKAQKEYEKDLGKVLNYWQKKKYLEYKSRRY